MCAADILTVTYDGGTFCPGPAVNRRMIINYTCSAVSAALRWPAHRRGRAGGRVWPLTGRRELYR